MAKRNAEQTFTLSQVTEIANKAVADAIAHLSGARTVGQEPTAPAVIGMLSAPPATPARVVVPAANPAALTMGEVKSKAGKNYSLVAYQYAGEEWTAVRYNEGEQQWPTRVGSLVLLNAEGQPFIVNSGEDRFEVLRFWACRAKSNMGERITVSAKDLPAALAILAPSGKPNATITITRSAVAGE